MEAKKNDNRAPIVAKGNKYTVEIKSTGSKPYGQLVKELILLDMSRN